MKRILIVHPSLNPPGGGNSVAAWVIEALREGYELNLLAWSAPRLERVNVYFGTSLRPADFRLRRVSPWLRRLVDALPTRGALLRHSAMARQARGVLRREAFDIVLGTQNEMDFGRRGIQYVHFPEGLLPRSEEDLRWYHRAFPPALAGYRRLSAWVAGSSFEGVRRNLTLVNSDWTGRKFSAYYGAETVTVYPPVAGDFSGPPAADREDGFVCIGRISPEKKLETVIEILAAVHGRHPTVRLHVVGSPNSPAYTREVLELARQRSWVQVHLDLPRVALLELMARNRYGIHGMVDEHFGIAVAELQRAGAIVFVPASGGPVEIVGGDDRLLYRSPGEAVEKIDRVLADRRHRESILAGVAERKDRFSSERFVAEIRAIVDGFGD